MSLVRVLILLVIALAIGLFVLVAVTSSGASFDQTKMAESQRIGNGIIAAIAAYYADHKTVPAQLSDLVPSYVSAITPPTTGTRKWHDHKARSDACYLSFVEDDDLEYPGCSREWTNGKTSDWYYDH
jgi:type II secretory pathway pseudopilin PulG